VPFRKNNSGGIQFFDWFDELCSFHKTASTGDFYDIFANLSQGKEIHQKKKNQNSQSTVN